MHSSRPGIPLTNKGDFHSMDELLKVSDIVSLNTLLTTETNGLLDKLFISKMKYGASLINTARCEILADIDDFIEPIKSGVIAGLPLMYC